jgi:hypothetical protein
MILRRAWRICGWCTLQSARLALWSVWLLLLLALAGQIHLLSSRRVPVPEPLRRVIQQQLAARGLRLDFNHGRMDFAGRFTFENLRVGPTSDPRLDFASARTAYVRFDPWQLVLGRLPLREARIDGVEIPGLDARFDVSAGLDERTVTLSYLSGYIGKLPVQARGLIRLPGVRPAPGSGRPAPLGDRLAAAWPGLLARARASAAWLAAAENPSLHLHFRERSFDVAAFADALDLPALPATARAVRATATLPVAFDPPARIRVNGSIDALDLPLGFSAQNLVFTLDASPGLDSARLDLQLASARWREITAGPVAATVRRTGPRDAAADLSVRLAGGDWRVQPSVAGDTARVLLDGFVDDAALAFAGGLVRRDLAALLDPDQAAPLHVDAVFGRGFALQNVTGTLRSGSVRVGRAQLDETGAEFTYDGARVVADALVLRQGASLARGSYEMDTRTLDFRFLLSGGLRPMGISGWFYSWWTDFWKDFDFSSSVPAADVDVQGRWGDPAQTRVFVRADNGPTGLKGVAFDAVSTRLFLRPHWFDIRHFAVARTDGEARGRFARALVPGSNTWTHMEFSVASTLPLPVISELFPGESTELLAPYAFLTPPSLQIDGRVDSAASASGKHESIDIALRSTGPMTYHGFPLSDLVFDARLRDDRIDLPTLAVTFARGRATGDARLSGGAGQRRLAFDVALADANLGQVIQAVAQLSPPAAPVSEKAAESARLRQQRLEGGRLDFSLKADGLYADIHSFNGAGRASVTDAELGQLNLFGPLSAALRGTALNLGSFSLTTVEAPFTLAGERVQFDDLRVTGPSALLLAKGRYGLRGGALDFTTRIHPFEENTSLFGSAASFVLTPFSKVFEVRLAGTLSEPSWIFSYGPSRLLNSLTGNNPPAPATPETPPADPSTP